MRTPASELAILESAHLRRRLRAPSELMNFSSNDYLGLATSDELKDVFQRAIADHGVGSGASRLVCGTHAPHLKLEAALATFKGTEASLSFSSGYAAAVGTLSGLLGKGDIVILDKLCHASLVDGARLSGATIRVFPHNDMEKLASHLAWANAQRSPETRILVVTESVFSMDGDRAPLDEIVKLKQEAGVWLLVDEAHALGIIGRGGRGLAEEMNLAGQIDLHFGTLSKAVGLSGGYVCGSRDVIDLLINRARSFIYSTAPPPAVAETAAYVIAQLLDAPAGQQLRDSLWRNTHRLSSAVPGLFQQPQSAILPVIIGSEDEAMRASQLLQDHGFLIPAIRYPTVSRGTARLRITVSSSHTMEQIDALTTTLKATLPQS